MFCSSEKWRNIRSVVHLAWGRVPFKHCYDISRTLLLIDLFSSLLRFNPSKHSSPSLGMAMENKNNSHPGVNFVNCLT